MTSFDENGKYIKTNWKAGDKITATKLNKIEESIEVVNDNDISRHVEADARLDALEAKDVAHDKEFTNVKNLIEDAKDAAELGDYEINSRMQFLEDDVEQAVNDMNNAVTTLRAFETELNEEVAGLKAVDKAIQNDVSEIRNNMSELTQYSLPTTKFNKAKLAWDKTDKHGQYEAWPYGTVFYDESQDNVCLIYNSKSTHTSSDGQVYFRYKKDYGDMSDAILVASGVNDSKFPARRCHGAGIDKDGNYLALVLHHGNSAHPTGDGVLWIHKSIDKGATWTETKAVVDGGDLVTCEAGSCYKLKSGKLLSFARLSPSPSSGVKIIRSDDGINWTGCMLDISDATDPLEGSFVELSDGSIYCIVRGTLYTGVFNVLENTYITHSNDGGLSWTPLEQLQNIDMTLANCCLIYHEDIKAIEMIHGSRLIQEDGKGSLYQRIFTEEQLKNHDLGVENRISTGAAGSDFGYVGGCKSKNNVVNIFYYDGISSSTEIYNMVGTRCGFVGKQGDDAAEGSRIISLKYGTITGAESPSYFSHFGGENNSKSEGVMILQRFGDVESRNNDNLPAKSPGILETLKVSSNYEYTRQLYTTLSGNIYIRTAKYAKDEWAHWNAFSLGGAHEGYNTDYVYSPFSEMAYTKTCYTITLPSYTNNMLLNIKNALPSGFSDYVDGVKLEVLYKGTAKSGTQVMTFHHKEFTTDMTNQRIVTEAPYEQNFYIETFLDSDGCVRMFLKNPSDVTMLVIRVIGVIFKRNIYSSEG